MHTLIDVRLLSPGGRSGIEEYTISLLDHLFQREREAFTLLYNGLHKAPLPSKWNNLRNVEVLDWHIPNKLFDAFSWNYDVFQIARHARADVVFSPHFNILPHMCISRVMTIHDLSFEHHPEFFSLRKRFWHWMQRLREQTRRARMIIAVSEFTKSDLLELYQVPAERVRVIYSGISSPSHLPSKEDVRAFRTSYSLERPFLLYLGTLEPRKNVQAVIRTFNALKADPLFNDLELVLAGRHGWLYDDILREARESKYHDAIRFFGHVENNLKPLLYASADLFLYPSFFEGFGFPPLEAQACGTPVIAANRTSLPEIIGDSAPLVDPWRIDEIEEEARALLLDTHHKNAMIARGIKNAARFTWDRAARETFELFESVAQG